MLAIITFVGFGGGSYSAFYLSKFNPLGVLKGSLSKSSSNITPRRAMVVIQFSLSMIMLIYTWVVYNQLSYLRSKDLGFNKDQVMTISANSGRGLRSKITAFKNEMQSNPQVLAASTSQAVPGSNINFDLLNIETKNGSVETGVYTYGYITDYTGYHTISYDKGRYGKSG